MNYHAARVALFLPFDPLKTAGPGTIAPSPSENEREFTVSLCAFLVPGASKFDEDSISAVSAKFEKVRNF